MANTDLSRESKGMKTLSTSGVPTAHGWFYEAPGGFDVVVEHRGPRNEWLGTSQHRIPWRAIRVAVDRKDRPADSRETNDRSEATD